MIHNLLKCLNSIVEIPTINFLIIIKYWFVVFTVEVYREYSAEYSIWVTTDSSLIMCTHFIPYSCNLLHRIFADVCCIGRILAVSGESLTRGYVVRINLAGHLLHLLSLVVQHEWPHHLIQLIVEYWYSMKTVKAKSFIVTCLNTFSLGGECQDTVLLAFSILGENRQFQMIIWYLYRTTNDLKLLESEPASTFHIERKNNYIENLKNLSNFWQCHTFVNQWPPWTY